MGKISEFIKGLKKSTKVTVLSCGSFVVLTLLILVFFIMFPITPSEKIMANIGRGENISQSGGTQPAQTAVPGVGTTVSTTQTTVATNEKTKATKRTTTEGTRTNYKIAITTGSGFGNNNGRIPTGQMPGYTYTETTVADYSEYGTEPYSAHTTSAHSGTGYSGGTEPYTPSYTTAAGGDNGSGNTTTPVVTSPNNGGGDTGTGGNTGGNTGGDEPSVPDNPVTPPSDGGSTGGGSTGGDTGSVEEW